MAREISEQPGFRCLLPLLRSIPKQHRLGRASNSTQLPSEYLPKQSVFWLTTKSFFYPQLEDSDDL